MKKMMSNMAMKPRDIRMNVENESRTHKYKIIGFSLLMAAISGSYQNYYDMLSWRISQAQAHYMAGTYGAGAHAQFQENNPVEAMQIRNTLAQVRSKGMKETKYQMESWFYGIDSNDNARTPEGLNTGDNYYTQTEFYTAPSTTSCSTTRGCSEEYVAGSDLDYERWEKLSMAVFFDTQVCLSGAHVWDSNKVTAGNWYEGSTSDNGFINDDGDRVASTNNGVSYGGDWSFADEDSWLDWQEAKLDLWDDCDLDCQAAGSQMSLVASLNGTALGFIGLNAIFMFIGTWRYRWRVCSVYCTLFSCLFQFAVIITSATMLFSKYTTTMCATSLQSTAGALPWMMADDWAVNVMLWIGQIFLMFGFLACGLCSAMKSED